MFIIIMALQRTLGFNKIQRITNNFHIKWTGLVEKIKNFETPEKFKGTFVERWGKYWRNVYLDYEEVALDIAKGCRTRPIRATFYASIVGGTCYLVKENPDEISYRRTLLRNTMRVIPVGESTRNPIAVQHIKFLEKCYNENIVRHLNLGILSFIWIDNYDSMSANYRATCTYLRPRYITFHQRIIDVGFLNTWWIWEDRMKDYDVNDEEFATHDVIIPSVQQSRV